MDFLRFLLFWLFGLFHCHPGHSEKCQITKTIPFSLTNEVNKDIAFVLALVWVCSPLFMDRKYGLTFKVPSTDNTDHQTITSPNRFGDADQ